MGDDEELTPSELAVRQVWSQDDWDREEAAGRLTGQHVAERLWRIAEHEFGDRDAPAAAAYDDDGFFISLTAAAVEVIDGVKLWICTGDHDPPHVHIKRPGKKDRVEDIRIRLSDGEIEGTLPRDVKSKQLKKFRALVEEYHDALCDTWTSYHGTTVDTAGLHVDD